MFNLTEVGPGCVMLDSFCSVCIKLSHSRLIGNILEKVISVYVTFAGFGYFSSV